MKKEQLSYHRLKYNLFIKIESIKTKYWYRFFLKKCGHNNIIMKPMFISFNVLEIGSFVQIRNNSRIEAVLEYNTESYNPRIIIQSNVSIEQNLHLTCASLIEIKENTSISANVTITDINHLYMDINVPIEKNPIETKNIIIGKDCKIYNNTVILPGTIIGNHCVVGANSVVSGNYPDYCIIVGAPSRIVKRYSFDKNEWLRTDKVGNFIDNSFLN